MSALQKLQEKIEQWRQDHENLKKQNADLRSQLAGVAGAQEEKEVLTLEVEAKTSQCTVLENNITQLKNELQEKDAEIEKIIAQVESLLS